MGARGHGSDQFRLQRPCLWLNAHAVTCLALHKFGNAFVGGDMRVVLQAPLNALLIFGSWSRRFSARFCRGRLARLGSTGDEQAACGP